MNILLSIKEKCVLSLRTTKVLNGYWLFVHKYKKKARHIDLTLCHCHCAMPKLALLITNIPNRFD